jgi:hypothetical protein
MPVLLWLLGVPIVGDRAPIPSQRHLVADGMAKPLDGQTDEELETALARGQ